VQRQSVSCSIVVFNEEQQIRECLETAKWMDEIIIVDAYSTDQTKKICEQYTNHVFQRKWNGFGEQKNFAIEQATSDWVFILDADERITPELRDEIENILASYTPDGPVAFSVPRKNFHFGKFITSAGCYPDYQLRLFRRGVGRLNDEEPHNKFVFQGVGTHLKAPLEHYTERKIQDYLRKHGNFTSLGAKERRKTKQTVYWSDLALRPLLTFYKYYIVRQGFRDGIQGFFVSVFAGMYTFNKYAKLFELLRASRKV
jgi:glycosyltransferase involved in cell wall biosynthesis